MEGIIDNKEEEKKEEKEKEKLFIETILENIKRVRRITEVTEEFKKV